MDTINTERLNEMLESAAAFNNCLDCPCYADCQNKKATTYTACVNTMLQWLHEKESES